MNLTEIYQACKAHLHVFPKGNLVLAFKKSKHRGKYRKFLNGPRGVVLVTTSTEDLVSFETRKVFEHCEKKLKNILSFGINPEGPSFNLDIRLINQDLLKTK